MNRKERRASGQSGAAPAGSSIAEQFAAAVAQHQAGVFAEAERRYRAVLSIDPAHADSLHNLGLIALQMGNANSAVEFIVKAIECNQRVGEYHYNIALAWRVLGRMDEVERHLARAVELRPDHALAHLNLGNVRREQGRAVDAVACYERALALNPVSAAARFNLANVEAQQGRWEAAIASYQKVLAIEPKRAEVHHRLGLALLALSRYDQAIAHLETAIAIRPDLHLAYENLADALLASGKPGLAAQTIARGIELNETPHGRALFAASVKSVKVTAENEKLRRLVLRALSESWARPRELDQVSISLIKLNPPIAACIVRATAAWPERLTAADLFGADGLAALAGDELLACLLRCGPIADVGIECLLTNVRLVILRAAAGDETLGCEDRDLAFYAAVAQQCFVNEYVYAATETEANEAEQLRSRLAQALASDASIPPLWPIAVGAYLPLHTIPAAEMLLHRPWPGCVEALMSRQIKEPMQEREIAATMPVLTAIDDEVSRAVRLQYEENPYPRWIQAGTPSSPAILKSGPQEIADVLIAGCGTGLSTVEFARLMPSARILAIDLSLASLSYANRMAQMFGLDKVEFAQADIMSMRSIGRTFDFIDASGVLHHLGDPWAGWTILLSLLRPNGVMQVGLYSEAARRNVVAARDLIAERGFRATPDDIRECRALIMASGDPLLKSIPRWEDFFSVSECRDLLFHVQEHRITLPQIKSFLADNALRFAGFVPEPTLLHQFEKRFPDQSSLLDLDCWRTLEDETPDLFAGMYQFWVRKPADPIAPETAT